MKKTNDSGKKQLVQAFQTKQFAPLYVLCGEETYLKEYYLKKLKEELVEKTFADFNLIELGERNISADSLSDALNGYPAMSDKKLVILRDYDIFKAESAVQEVIMSCVMEWPEYLHLLLFYDTSDFKPIKTTKIYKSIKDFLCIAEFGRLAEKELIAWVQRTVKSYGVTIDSSMSSYLIFKCGNDMTRLLTEIQKACAHTTTGEVKQYNIDSVCSPTLEAVVFDLTDAISQGNYENAIRKFNDLLAQKNNEVMLFSIVTRHIQRLYAAKICKGKDALKKAIASNSDYYISQLQRTAQRISISWLRSAASLCAEMDSVLKSSSADKGKQIELAFLTLSTLT